MSAAKPEHRRFQFSLRKALLWMVAWALYLGLITWLVDPLEIVGIITVYVACTLGIRILAGYRLGWLIASVATGALYCVVGGMYIALSDSVSITEFVLFIAIFFLIGAQGGFLWFIPVHAVASTIDWIDQKMESKRQPSDVDTPFSP